MGQCIQVLVNEMSKQISSELDMRLRALESGSQQGEDLDAHDWFWLLVLGVLIPALLLAIGWWWA